MARATTPTVNNRRRNTTTTITTPLLNVTPCPVTITTGQRSPTTPPASTTTSTNQGRLRNGTGTTPNHHDQHARARARCHRQQSPANTTIQDQDQRHHPTAKSMRPTAKPSQAPVPLDPIVQRQTTTVTAQASVAGNRQRTPRPPEHDRDSP